MNTRNIRPAWCTSLFSVAMVSLASAGWLLSADMAYGEDAKPVVNEKFSDLAPAIADLRQEAGQDRREIVEHNMLLTASESAVFWPLYDQYRADMSRVGDRRVRLITDFLAQRDSMSEGGAAALSKEYFSIEKARVEVKEKHFGKMSKVLSSRTVARFFQIDGKLDAVTDMALAARIPLGH